MIAILADAFVKATVLLVLAAIVTLCLRHSPAALRHLVWSLACGGVLALPLASALLPNWRVAGWPRLDVPIALDVAQVAGASLGASREHASTPPRTPSASVTGVVPRSVPSSTVD